MSAIHLPPDESDAMTSRAPIPSVVPRLMVVVGGTMVLVGAWLLGSGTRPQPNRTKVPTTANPAASPPSRS